MTNQKNSTQQTPYQRGFYDGSRGLTAAYYPPQPGDPHAEYSRGFHEGRIERDRLNSRPINPQLKPAQTTQTVKERMDASMQYLGSGTYRGLSPVITAHGSSLGWRYDYPTGINLNGVVYTQMGETLDSLEANGIIELREQNMTAF